MGDKETRKRKKRRETAKKEETDDSSPPREPVQDISGKKKVEDHSTSHNLNEPSILAKLVFCVLFMLLMSAVGLIFYALNEATRSSEVIDGEVDEIAKSASLPIIDDLPSESQHDLVSDDEEGEEGRSAASIENIINSIEESVMYNIDEDNEGHQEIYFDNLNDEKESDAIQSIESAVPKEGSNIELADRQENVISTPTAEDFILSSSVESAETKTNPPSEDVDLFETYEHEAVNELESTTNPSLEAVHGNSDAIEKNPNMPDQAAFLDDLDNEDDTESEDNDAESLSESLINEALSNIQPSLVLQANEQSEGNVGNQDAAVQESVDKTEENPQTPSQYENEDITNDYDFLFREELDEGDKLIEKEPENGDFYFWNF